jgi:hypothetical protein
VTLEAGEGVERVREQVRQYDLEDAVVIVTVEGEGDPVSPATIEEFADEQGALVARMNDRRELDDESEIEVHFADPDAAVRERVRELGLSEAARGIDETVRESGVARTNVRQAVTDRIGDRLADDPGAFDRVPEDDADETDAPAADDDPETDDDTEQEDEHDTGEATTDAGSEETDDRSDAEEPAETDDRSDAEEPAETDDRSEPEETRASEGNDENAQQASMEEYL